MRRPLALLALALAGSLSAQEPCREPSSYIFPADLTPAFEIIEARGLSTEGPRKVMKCVEAFFRPVPAEAAALFIPWVGIDNIHIPRAMRGEKSPGCTRSMDWLCPHRVDLGESEATRTVYAGVMLHELAHAEYDVFARSAKHRRGTPRLQRQYDDVRQLREIVKSRPGFDKWPWVQAQEMAAYYIETSIHAVIERIESVFLANRFNVNRVIQSAEDRAALVVDGEEVLLASREDASLGNLWRTDPAHIGGRRGDAFFEGEPIDAEIPLAIRERLFEDIFGLDLPRTGDEIVAAARALKGPWAENQRRLIAHARDRRVERLQREAAALEPSFEPLSIDAGAGGGPDGALSAEEEALLARVRDGSPPDIRGAPRHGAWPQIGLAHYERE